MLGMGVCATSRCYYYARLLSEGCTIKQVATLSESDARHLGQKMSNAYFRPAKVVLVTGGGEEVDVAVLHPGVKP